MPKDDRLQRFLTRHGLNQQATEELSALISSLGGTVPAGPNDRVDDSLALGDTALGRPEDLETVVLDTVALVDSAPNFSHAHGAAMDISVELPLPAGRHESADDLLLELLLGHVDGEINRVEHGRYEDLGRLDIGGMAEIRRVRDTSLNRIVCMKVIKAELLERSSTAARFIAEAQATAQLQHPAIVPVHEMGRLADGRLFFTMKEVKGRTLAEVIQEVHEVSGATWRAASSGWTFRRLIEAFRKTCEAVAYAHSRGVIHRDLKPANVMLGEFGEVCVLDWGLAKVLEQDAIERLNGPKYTDSDDWEPIETTRKQRHAPLTQVGIVAGTPAYMSPEQARGRVDLIGPGADVYALGALLYEILAGRPPFTGSGTKDILKKVLAGRIVAPSELHAEEAAAQPPGLGAPASHPGHAKVPKELEDACLRAMSPIIGDRYPNAGALETEVGAWLDGSRKQEQALELVASADALDPDIDWMLKEAAELDSRAKPMLIDAGPTGPESTKQDAWAMEDQADTFRRVAALKVIEKTQFLQTALSHFPNLPEAHARLANYYREGHRKAEKARDKTAMMARETLLRIHDRGDHAEYLEGKGQIAIETEPPSALTIHKYSEHNRRLMAVQWEDFETAKTHETELDMGSYLLELSAEGFATARYPVSLTRLERLSCALPGDDATQPIRLLPKAALGDDEIYIPGGWFWSGGDATATRGAARTRLWVDSFVIKRFVVTNADYLAFLNDIKENGRYQEALLSVPRGRRGGSSELFYPLGETGLFRLPEGEGPLLFQADLPVVLVDKASAERYCRWEAERSGLAWRLPHEIEWEKAARGTDGRVFPWGDYIDPTWCCTEAADQVNASPVAESTFPVDVGPYGVRHMAGNVAEWCMNSFRAYPRWTEGERVDLRSDAARADAGDTGEGPTAVRGGYWDGHVDHARAASRRGLVPTLRESTLGFRMVRSVFNDDSSN